MIPLLKKELRQLWPLAILGVLLSSGDVLTRPFTEQLDQKSWEDIASYVDPTEDGGFAWISLLLAVAVAYSTFVREHEERTIDYLLSLPVRRSQVFAAKVLAGWIVLAIPLVTLAFTDGVMGSLSPETLEGGHWRADVALTCVALQLGFVLIAHAHGLLASVFRLFGLIPYAVVLVVIGIVEDLVPAAAWMDPTELLVPRYEGRALVVPWTPLAAHGAIGAAALGLAGLLWMGPAARIGRGLERAKASVLGKVALGFGALLTLAGLATLAIVVGAMRGGGERGAGEGERPPTASRETVTADTARYRFTYPVSHAERATALMGEADAIHAAVCARLGAEPGPRLVADLTEVSGEHRGIASWTHVRVGLVTEPDDARLRHTFAHETTHAVQHRLSDRRQGDEGRATHLFAEGSAEWVAYEVVATPEDRARARIVAAAMWARHDLSFEVLADDDRLRERFDASLVYPVGEVWAEALVTACGEGSIGDALRAMGREGAPRDLSPGRFWDDTLASSGCDLERVNAAFERIMGELEVTHAAAIDAIPRVGVGMVDGELIAALDRPLPAGMEILGTARRGPDSDDAARVSLRAEPTGDGRWRVRVPRGLLGARRFQVQLGVRPHPDGWVVGEPWQWVSAP